MIRSFLSHSSNDKKKYVKIVADKLGPTKCIYDGYTFEEGMKTLDEITKNLKASQIFVLFISDDALNSDWVKDEILQAKNLESKGVIKKIYPIIIDEKVTHSDSRIPDWMRDEYNLKYISRPVIAARRIEEHLRIVSWDNHPKTKMRDLVFVGRNELMEEFEERFDDYSKRQPICAIASGIKSIGRRTFIRNGLIKTDIIRKSYSPPTITLNRRESIEDFILKANDLGFSSDIVTTNLLETSIEEKIKTATKLAFDIKEAKEILFIEDDRCIVSNSGTLVDWFSDILIALSATPEMCFALASSNTLSQHKYRSKDNIYSTKIYELTPKERRRLLKRYLDLEQQKLANEDFELFSNLLSGLPEQAAFAVEVIAELGIDRARTNTQIIKNFNTDRISNLIQAIEKDQFRLDLLSLLCRFDFISYKFLFEITDEQEKTNKALNEYITYSFCELIGANGEYIRVNDVVRDYVLRARVDIPQIFKHKISEHLEDFLNNYNESVDLSDFLFSLKELLRSGKTIDEKYLIPSHFLKTMKEIYDSRGNMNDVVKLADRVMNCSQYLDDNIIHEIIYYLCLALARLKNPRCLEEVQKIAGPEHNFILGFYYNQKRLYNKAIEQLDKAISGRPNFLRAKHQLVQVYISIEEYEKAEILAKQLYQYEPKNAFYVQSYINCLLHNPIARETDQEISKLLDHFETLTHTRAKEMYMSAKALYLALWKENEQEALSIINEAIILFPKVPYPQINKFKICQHFGNIDCMKEALDAIDDKDPQHHFAYQKSKCLYLAGIGKPNQAKSIVEGELATYPQYSKNKLLEKINHIASAM